MRQLAVVVAAAVVFAMIAPAQAQPFSDVPTNHWAYDAIAELAAKGLMEGYPDGTFKGDRTMTRYEMAMIVARLLARIESIQIPAPQGPQVTRTDVQSVQRLVNEFRAELAALGVRVTAIEEELNAIKAKMDNVRITGKFRMEYNMQRFAGCIPPSLTCPIGGNGNANTFSTDASARPTVPLAREFLRLSFDGSVAPDVHLILSLLTGGGGSALAGNAGQVFQTFNSSAFGFGASAGQYVFGTVDNVFFDWRNAFGMPIEVWLGRFGGTYTGTTYPVQFGPFGLLMNTSGDTWEDSTGESGANVVDGLAVFGHWASLADLQVQALIARVIGGLSGTSYFNGEDAYGVDANVQLMPGLRLGGYYVANNINPAGNGLPGTVSNPSQFGALWHVYGPGGGSVNPVTTTNCPAVTAGVYAGFIQCAAAGSGGGGYLGWDAFPGIHFDGEYAVWNDSVHGTNDSGWQVNATWDLGTLMGVGHNLLVQTGYVNFGQNFYPPYGGAEGDIAMQDWFYPGNQQGFQGEVSWDPITNWNLYGIGFLGNNLSNGQPISEWEAGVKYKFAPGTDARFIIRDLRVNSIEQFLLYRAQVNYSF